MQTTNPQENNVSESTPKKFDKKLYQKAYYEANKEKLKAYSKNYEKTRKRDRKEYYKAYHEANKNKEKEKGIIYRETNKDKIKEYKKNYRKINRQKLKDERKIYRKQRLKEDPLFAAKTKLRNLVLKSFKRIGKNKPTDTLSLLGCSWIEAKEHFERLFEEGMSWENHGLWEIDHIRPVASFKEDELHLMNLISNLQPLWAEENREKNDKFI